MERKLIANYLVPDNEVWVSPATWERPLSLKVKESTVTDTQHTHTAICPSCANEHRIMQYHGKSWQCGLCGHKWSKQQ